MKNIWSKPQNSLAMNKWEQKLQCEGREVTEQHLNEVITLKYVSLLPRVMHSFFSRIVATFCTANSSLNSFLLHLPLSLYINCSIILFYFILSSAKSTRNIMSTLHHTKLQVDGPSGHCSQLHLHSPPEVQ